MKNKAYCNAFNQIKFSSDFEDTVIRAIEEHGANGKVTSDFSLQKAAVPILLCLAAVITLFFGLRGQNERAVNYDFAETTQSAERSESTTVNNAGADANAAMESGSVTFRDYGENAIYIESDSYIYLEDISEYVDAESITGICLYDCESKTSVPVPLDGNFVECEISEPGIYILYAVLNNGEAVNLSRHVVIDTNSDAKCTF